MASENQAPAKWHSKRLDDRKTEWICDQKTCMASNYPSRLQCRVCNKTRRTVVVFKSLGDWRCVDAHCSGLNFRNRTQCYMCQKPRVSI